MSFIIAGDNLLRYPELDQLVIGHNRQGKYNSVYNIDFCGDTCLKWCMLGCVLNAMIMIYQVDYMAVHKLCTYDFMKHVHK